MNKQQLRFAENAQKMTKISLVCIDIKQEQHNFPPFRRFGSQVILTVDRGKGSPKRLKRLDILSKTVDFAGITIMSCKNPCIRRE